MSRIRTHDIVIVDLPCKPLHHYRSWLEVSFNRQEFDCFFVWWWNRFNIEWMFDDDWYFDLSDHWNLLPSLAPLVWLVPRSNLYRLTITGSWAVSQKSIIALSSTGPWDVANLGTCCFEGSIFFCCSTGSSYLGSSMTARSFIDKQQNESAILDSLIRPSESIQLFSDHWELVWQVLTTF